MAAFSLLLTTGRNAINGGQASLVLSYAKNLSDEYEVIFAAYISKSWTVCRLNADSAWRLYSGGVFQFRCGL